MSKIVIIEDSTLIAKLYENKLLAEDHIVRVAFDGETGLDIVKEFKPDLVMLDLMLPKMSGIEVIAELRKLPEFADLPILAYSGADKEVLAKAREAGSTQLVSKNESSLKEIMAHLNKLLQMTSQPAADAAEAGIEEKGIAPLEETTPTAGRRVLVVEDDLLIVKLVQNIVETAGYQPVVAQDGREAYRLLANDANFVAGIFDIHIPHISGTDLLRYMRTEKRLMKIPVIVMTTEESVKIQLDSLSAGASVFLPKPFERKTFEIMFATLVNR